MSQPCDDTQLSIPCQIPVSKLPNTMEISDYAGHVTCFKGMKLTVGEEEMYVVAILVGEGMMIGHLMIGMSQDDYDSGLGTVPIYVIRRIPIEHRSNPDSRDPDDLYYRLGHDAAELVQLQFSPRELIELAENALAQPYTMILTDWELTPSNDNRAITKLGGVGVDGKQLLLQIDIALCGANIGDGDVVQYYVDQTGTRVRLA